MAGRVAALKPGDQIQINRGGHKFLAGVEFAAGAGTVYGRILNDSNTNITPSGGGVSTPLTAGTFIIDDGNENYVQSNVTVNLTAGTITVSGPTRLFKIRSVFRLVAITPTVSCRLNIEVNGVVEARSVVQSNTGADQFHEAMATLNLSNGDVVRLAIQNQTNTTDIRLRISDRMKGDVGAVNPTNGFLEVIGL